jgi:hypothetical protein
MRSLLTKGQVAAKHADACGRKQLRQDDQQRRIAITAGAMGKDQSITGGSSSLMEDASHRLLAGSVVKDVFNARIGRCHVAS